MQAEYYQESHHHICYLTWSSPRPDVTRTLLTPQFESYTLLQATAAGLAPNDNCADHELLKTTGVA